MARIEGTVADTLRARFGDPAGWEDLQRSVRERIDARRRKYGADPKSAEPKNGDTDRKIQNYYRASARALTRPSASG
jgi:hypothetical protein